MKKVVFLAMMSILFVTACDKDKDKNKDKPQSLYSQYFSVSDTQKVVFSPGNLQWSATNGGSTPTTHTVADGTAAGTWRFAPNQWDMVGWEGNTKISYAETCAYTGWIDLFGWGTSGYNNKYPYIESHRFSDYYGNTDIAGTNYDWGVYNAIYNPKTQTTDDPGTWRTLTKDECDYLLNTRPTASNIRYARANVHGVNGLIIVPDNWSNSIYSLNERLLIYQYINTSDWTKMEAAGCVFLPAAGNRDSDVRFIGTDGYYWLSSLDRVNCHAYGLYVGTSEDRFLYYSYIYKGFSVRLVKDVE